MLYSFPARNITKRASCLHLLIVRLNIQVERSMKAINIQISMCIRVFFFLRYVFLARHRSSQVGVNYIYGRDCKVH